MKTKNPKVSDLEIAKAFRVALRRLSPVIVNRRRRGEKYRFICHAIADVDNLRNNKPTPAQIEAKRIVMVRLRGGHTLENWLVRRGFDPWKGDDSGRRIQAHRKAWLKLLIAEFEEKARVPRVDPRSKT